MKRPQPLQVVLALRLRQQDSAERVLSEALAQQRQARQQLSTLQEQLQYARSAPNEPAGELIDLVDLQVRALRVPHLQQLCAKAETALSERQAHTEEKRLLYLEARRAREAVEALLKQRTLVEQQKQTRRETKVSEDLFLGRLVRHKDVEGSAL